MTLLHGWYCLQKPVLLQNMVFKLVLSTQHIQACIGYKHLSPQRDVRRRKQHRIYNEEHGLYI